MDVEFRHQLRAGLGAEAVEGFEGAGDEGAFEEVDAEDEGLLLKGLVWRIFMIVRFWRTMFAGGAWDGQCSGEVVLLVVVVMLVLVLVPRIALPSPPNFQSQKRC